MMTGYQMNNQKGNTTSKWRTLLLLSLLLPAAAGMSNTPQKYDYVMKVNNSALAVVDSNLVVSLKLTAIQDIPASQSVILAPEIIDTTSLRSKSLPLIFLNSRNQQIYFDRNLRPKYPDALVLRKKKGVNLNVDYLRTTKFEPWMENAVLKLKRLSCACDKQKVRGEEIVAGFAPKEEAAPEVNLYPVYLLPPADNSVKVREEKGSAYLCFVVNKWDILTDYMTNPEELQKIHNSVNIVKNDSNVTITRMVIEGYASPEGTYKHNMMLSENRTEALRKYLQRSGIAKGIRMEASGKGENWAGFVKQLKEDTSTPGRDILLRIANSSIGPDEKEAQMRRDASAGYRYYLDNVFPKLRCTNYTVEYTVRPFTVEESEVVFETRPINLNLNEIYKLAGKYASDRQKYYNIIRKAYLLYPNDSYINLTMAYLSIQRGVVEAAEEHLGKVNDCPQKTMNEGLVAYMKGDLDRAIQLVEQAAQQGVPEATEQLAEFKKLQEYKQKTNK